MAVLITVGTSDATLNVVTIFADVILVLQPDGTVFDVFHSQLEFQSRSNLRCIAKDVSYETDVRLYFLQLFVERLVLVLLHIVVQFATFGKDITITHIVDVFKQVVFVISSIKSSIGENLADVGIMRKIVVQPLNIVSMIKSVENLKLRQRNSQRIDAFEYFEK